LLHFVLLMLTESGMPDNKNSSSTHNDWIKLVHVMHDKNSSLYPSWQIYNVLIDTMIYLETGHIVNSLNDDTDEDNIPVPDLGLFLPSYYLSNGTYSSTTLV
jgi:hypothetical protein